MSPRRFLDDDHNRQLIKTGTMINGPRPAPLKLKQESHTAHKHHNQQMRKGPIIIYLRSPEVIHTKPHEFMALVQKLTGLHSGSNDQDQQQIKTLKQERQDLINYNGFSIDSGHVTHERSKSMTSKSPMFNTSSNRCIADVPLFTPITSDRYFFSPQRFLKLSDVLSSSILSPGSLVEMMKEAHEY
ncbi:hypothetical protein R6Q59_030207 [Mikania micrantha]|uniref:VQ domain-containing protein n=1 Tax=Mikania micrantha TaxID=192012 RepID=A0A5N6LU21_9ASTR|nr:hypothetical protein E3N88_37649 [Mikania micrantha]